MADLVDKFEQVNAYLNDSRGDLAATREELVDRNAKLKAYEKAQVAYQGPSQVYSTKEQENKSIFEFIACRPNEWQRTGWAREQTNLLHVTLYPVILKYDVGG